MSDLTRPGVLPLRPLTTGELLDGAIAVLRTRPGRLVGLGILLAILEQAALYPLRSLSDQDISLLPGTGRLAEFGFLVVAGFATEAMIIATLATVAAGRSGRVLLGRFAPPPAPVRRFSATGVVLVVGLAAALTVAPFPAVLESLQSAGFPVAWTLAIVVWAVPYGLLGLAAPALVIEHRTAGSALARSVRLASRDGLRAVWIRVLAWASWALVRNGLVIGVVVLLAVVWGGSLPSSTWDRIAIAAALVIINAIAYPVLGCLDTMLLLEGRMRTEGLDISLRWALRRGVAPSLEAP